jgi:hypothetical protein
MFEREKAVEVAVPTTKSEPKSVPTLTRSPLKDISGELADLAVAARDVLGYKPLARFIHASDLAMALKNLGIQPLDADLVVKYKFSKMANANAELKSTAELRGVYYGWRMVKIEEYVSPIPEFVLRKAIAIKETCPQVMLFVDELTTMKPDPFLVAALDGEIFWVEVWDEPKFEAAI